MNYTYSDIAKKLKKLGFVFYRQAAGSHEYWVHEEKSIQILLVNHGSKTLSKGVIKTIIEDTGLSNKEFSEL